MTGKRWEKPISSFPSRKRELCSKAGFEFRIREPAGLVHAPDSLLDAQSRSRKVGVLGTDAVADATERDDYGGFSDEWVDREGTSQQGEKMQFGHGVVWSDGHPQHGE